MIVALAVADAVVDAIADAVAVAVGGVVVVGGGILASDTVTFSARRSA